MTSTRRTTEVADVDPDRSSELERTDAGSPVEGGEDLAKRQRLISVPEAGGATTVAKPGFGVKLEQLRAFYGDAEQVKGIDLDFRANEVTAIIGPSGCGKSTMVRCINRMHEEIPGARAEGRVLLDGMDIYDPAVDVVAVRRAVGMVFQKPNPFPTMSIYDNVAAGLRLSGRRGGDLTPRSRRRSAGRACGARWPGGSRRPVPGCRAGSSSASASPARSPSNRR